MTNAFLLLGQYLLAFTATSHLPSDSHYNSCPFTSSKEHTITRKQDTVTLICQCFNCVLPSVGQVCRGSHPLSLSFYMWPCKEPFLEV